MPALAAAGLAAGDSPTVSPEMLEGLKFSTALPAEMAAAVVAARMTDAGAAEAVVNIDVVRV